MLGVAAIVWLLALPLAAAPLIYLVGRLALADGRAAPGRPLARVQLFRRAWHPARWVALAVLAVAWTSFGVAARDLAAGGQTSVSLGTIGMRVDGLSLLVAALALGLGTLATIFSGPNLAGRVGEEKYYALIVVITSAMIGLACASDRFNLWVWFETMAIASYLLVAFAYERPAALEAAVKYLVQSAAGSILVLLGIALVLAETGTLNLAEIRAGAHPSPVLLAAGGLFLAGFGVKAALVPLHTWLPDAHEQAPSAVSAMLSGVVIKAGVVALLRALGALAGVTLALGPLLIVLGMLNIVVGNLAALRQPRLKRMLAYSSVGQMGYVFFGMGIGMVSGQAAGFQGGLFHILTHGLMSGLGFLSVGALMYGLHDGRGDQPALTIADIGGAAQRYPLAALGLSVAVLGLAGLPALAGSMSKWQIFVAGFATRDPVVWVLVGFAAMNSTFSLAYYAPVVNALYRAEQTAAVRAGRPLPPALVAPVLVLALAVVAIGVWPALAEWLIEPAGAALLEAFGR